MGNGKGDIKLELGKVSTYVCVSNSVCEYAHICMQVSVCGEISSRNPVPYHPVLFPSQLHLTSNTGLEHCSNPYCCKSSPTPHRCRKLFHNSMAFKSSFGGPRLLMNNSRVYCTFSRAVRGNSLTNIIKQCLTEM